MNFIRARLSKQVENAEHAAQERSGAAEKAAGVLTNGLGLLLVTDRDTWS